MHAPVFISYPRDNSHGQLWAEAIEVALTRAGIRCWRDVNDIATEGFSRAIEAGIEQCDLVLVVVSRQTVTSDWVPNELTYAKGIKKPIMPVLVEQGAEMPLEVNTINPLRMPSDPVQMDWGLLIGELARLGVEPGINNTVAGAIPLLQREDELAWLSDLCHLELTGFDRLYTPLHADERKRRGMSGRINPTIAHSSTVLQRFAPSGSADACAGEKKTQHFDDVLDAFRSINQRREPRLALLGEPGAGKTFSLRRIQLELAQAARDDEHAPLPLFVSLKYWTRHDESLQDFLSRELGRIGMGRYWRALRDQKRAVLLLDAINELPTQQHAHKAEQIDRFIRDDRWRGVVVSCRARDFERGFSLPLDKLTVQPLTPMQVHDFVQRYFGEDSNKAEGCFWFIAGGWGLQVAFFIWNERGISLKDYWSGIDPRELVEDISPYSDEYRKWQRVHSDTRNLMRLAANPFLLNLMTQIYAEYGRLPDSRSQLFAGFVDTLLGEEAKRCHQRGDAPPERGTLLAAVQALATHMQRVGLGDQAEGAQISLAVVDSEAVLSETFRHQACNAGLLHEQDGNLSFGHQLMQEYLSAMGLWSQISSGALRAESLWPAETWWQRNGWEVTLELLGEQLAANEQIELLKWLGEANPDLASEMAGEWGVSLSRAFLERQKARWLPHITDLGVQPHARAAAARALGRWGLDDRTGIGLHADGLPDIDWVSIAAEPFYYQNEDAPRTLPAFAISRYLVTYAQYQAFIDDDGYSDDRWWQGLAKRFEEPAQPSWCEANSPRETVSWYEAVAYCRWLSHRSGLSISLPTEQQFERVARGPKWQPEFESVDYPWHGKWDNSLLNCELGLSRTSAVGVYLGSRSVEGVEDVSGNLWEWQLNVYENPDNTAVKGDSARALRGGSWYDDSGNCRSSIRSLLDPVNRNFSIGFRLSCLSPI